MASAQEQIAKGGAVQRKQRTKQRNKSVIVLVPGYDSGGTPVKVCWTFDPSVGCEELCKIDECSTWHSVCELPGGFALTGGKTAPTDHLCMVFDLATKSWKQLEALKISRYGHGSIVMHGKIFLFGGCASGSWSASVHSMQLEGGTWTAEPDVPITVGYPEVAIASDKIFLLDVFDTNQLLQLDVEQMTWSNKAVFPGGSYSIRGARMVSVQDQLLVAGGNIKTFGSYNPSTDTWWTGTGPSLQHDFGALIHHGEKLYFMGGDEEDRVEEYDLNAKAWSVSDVKVPGKLTNLHAVSV